MDGIKPILDFIIYRSSKGDKRFII